MSFSFTKFDNLQGFSLTLEDLEIDQLRELIETTIGHSPADLPLGKLCVFGSLPSPPKPDGTGGGSLRWDGNVRWVTGIEIDIDSGQMSLEEARDRLNSHDLIFVLHTTKRHTTQHPRLKIWLPFSKPLPAHERSRMVDRVHGLLGATAAPESWTLSQGHYVGRILGVDFEIVVGDGGQHVDEAEELDKIRRRRPGPTPHNTPKGGKPDLKDLDEDQLEDEIRNQRAPFHASGRLIWLWALQEIPKADAQTNLEDIFDSIPIADRGPKWAGHRAAIPKWVDRMYARAARHMGTFLAKLVTYLSDDLSWRGALRLNGFSQIIEVCEPYPPQPGQVFAAYRALREVDTLETLLIVQAKGFPKAAVSDVWRAIILAAEHQGYHPVREYLDGLKWDGAARIDRLFATYFPGELPPEDNHIVTIGGVPQLSWRDKWVSYYEATARCFMIGAVARIFEPGCKVDSLPIFVSEQRYYKGLALQALVGNPAWFSDDVPIDITDKDAKDALVGKWIVEFSEMPHLRREVERFKAYVSRQSDRFRRAYERLTQDWPRQTALTGTSNDLTYLDTTGNRRFWAIPLADRANVELIKRDRDQLWAEAVHLYKHATPWWLSDAMEDIAAEIQAGYVDDDLLETPIREWIEKRRDKQTKRVAPFEMAALYPALREPLGLGSLGLVARPTVPSTADQGRIANCLKRLGFRRRLQRANGTRARVWVERN